MEIFYILIPSGLFFASFIVRCFIIVGFWEIINIGRTMLLESISMILIAYIHFSIEIKNFGYLEQYCNKYSLRFDEVKGQFLPTIKLSEEPMILVLIGVIMLIIFFILSISEKHMNGLREKDLRSLIRKYKDFEENYSVGYYFHVIISFLFGVLSLLFVFFIYSYKGIELKKSLLAYFLYPGHPGFYALSIIVLLILLGALFTVRKEATLASRKWSADKPSIER